MVFFQLICEKVVNYMFIRIRSDGVLTRHTKDILRDKSIFYSLFFSFIITVIPGPDIINYLYDINLGGLSQLNALAVAGVTFSSMGVAISLPLLVLSLTFSSTVLTDLMAQTFKDGENDSTTEKDVDSLSYFAFLVAWSGIVCLFAAIIMAIFSFLFSASAASEISKKVFSFTAWIMLSILLYSAAQLRYAILATLDVVKVNSLLLRNSGRVEN
ncbi:hypothetical protein [Corynebacterium durum]|uniref:hypothetical protein n=1 Tax=Corynebacterium durum TaxID=61592 RepID=UPI0028E9DB38|nr:hypothetical protein [Corynebacterium durum]